MELLYSYVFNCSFVYFLNCSFIYLFDYLFIHLIYNLCRVDFRAQEESSSAIVQHSLNVFRPSSAATFTIIRNILVTFPFLVYAFLLHCACICLLARLPFPTHARGHSCIANCLCLQLIVMLAACLAQRH